MAYQLKWGRREYEDAHKIIQHSILTWIDVIPSLICIGQKVVSYMDWTLNAFEAQWGLSCIQNFKSLQCEKRHWCDFLVDIDSLLSSKVIFDETWTQNNLERVWQKKSYHPVYRENT